MRVLKGHNDAIDSVAMTPDGRLAITGGGHYELEGGGTSLCVWDISRGRVVGRLRGHTRNILAVGITLDGRFAVSAGYDLSVFVWDVERSTCVWSIQHSRPVRAVAISDDGNIVISGGGTEGDYDGGDKGVRVADRRGGSSSLLDRHYHMVSALAISPSGDRAVIASQDTLFVYDDTRWNSARKLEGQGGTIYSVALSRDGRIAISSGGGDGQTLRVWAVKEGTCIRGWGVPQSGTRTLGAVALTADGRLAVSGSSDGTVRVWDVGQGKCLRLLEGHTDSVGGVAISSDGSIVVSGASDHTLRVWEG